MRDGHQHIQSYDTTQLDLYWVYIGQCQKYFICGSATWVFGHKKNRHLLLFFKNGGDGKNDNHILVGSKLSVACSESTRCRGLTIFENEAVKAKTRPSFYSKILIWTVFF